MHVFPVQAGLGRVLLPKEETVLPPSHPLCTQGSLFQTCKNRDSGGHGSQFCSFFFYPYPLIFCLWEGPMGSWLPLFFLRGRLQDSDFSSVKILARQGGPLWTEMVPTLLQLWYEGIIPRPQPCDPRQFPLP